MTQYVILTGDGRYFVTARSIEEATAEFTVWWTADGTDMTEIIHVVPVNDLAPVPGPFGVPA